MGNVTTNAKDIVVIDTSDAAGTLSQAFRGFTGLTMSSVKTMAANVYAQVIKQHADIRGLRILDHGNQTGCQMGKDWVTTANFSTYWHDLGKLKGTFCPYSGFVQLQHCLMGKNTPLMHEFAKLWNVPVYGGEWYTNALGLNIFAYEYEGLSGAVKAVPNPFKGFQQWVRVDPSGAVTYNVSVP